VDEPPKLQTIPRTVRLPGFETGGCSLITYYPVLQRRPFAGPRDMERRAVRPDPPGEVAEWLIAPHSKCGYSHFSP
jgi:hypothetical protein